MRQACLREGEMDRIGLPILVTLTLCGCIGVIRHTGSLPVAGEPASGWTIEPGATLATGAILATSGARIQLKVNNGNISKAKGISFSPWSPVGLAPMNTNEWESPAPHFVVTVSIVENDAGLSIDPANIR